MISNITELFLVVVMEMTPLKSAVDGVLRCGLWCDLCQVGAASREGGGVSTAFRLNIYNQLKERERGRGGVRATTANTRKMLPSTFKTETRSCQFWVWLADSRSPLIHSVFPVIKPAETQRGGDDQEHTPLRLRFTVRHMLRKLKDTELLLTGRTNTQTS